MSLPLDPTWTDAIWRSPFRLRFQLSTAGEKSDGGNYISSGIVLARHPQHGQNVDFHRCMQISRRELAMRVVQSRHFSQYLNELKAVDVAICVGNGPNVLAAAATSGVLTMLICWPG